MSSFCLGVGLSLKQRWVGANTPTPTPTPTASTITALEVLNATVLPDGADAAVPNGWIASATLPDDGVSTFDPTKIALTVQDPGFDTDGSAVTRTRTITGTEIVRKQYPNQAQRLNDASGGARTVYFALSEDIYAGSTITAANAVAGYYGAAAAGSIAGVVNNSTLTYPLPQIGWLNMQHERATGAGFAVEAVAYHDLARNGQQVACVEFYGRDAQGTPNTTAVQRCSTQALSDFQIDGPKVEAWKATIPLAALTQGDLCQVIAVVKPWIGTALDLSVAGPGVYGTLTPGSAVDTAQPATPLRFLCDKTGGYGGAIAYFKATGTASSADLTKVFTADQPYPLADSDCYASFNSALAAAQSWNSANKGHNDTGGAIVYAMDDGAGGAVDHAINATSARASGKCWADVKVAPGATGAVRFTVTGLIQVVSLLRFSVPFYVNATGNNALDGATATNTRMIGFEGGSVTYGASQPAQGLTYRIGLGYWRNVSFTDAVSPFQTFSNNRNAAALVLGCTGNFIGSTKTAYPYTFVGNSFSRLQINEVPASHATAFPHDGAILANNILLSMPNVAAMGDARSIDGFARVQNVFETSASYSAGAAAWRIGADDQTSAIDHFVSMHNTVPGAGVAGSNQGRQNAGYADVAGAAGVQKRITEKFDLLHQRNVKTDTFTDKTTVTGRTGDWRYRYGVGNLGVVVVTGDANGPSAASPSGGNWSGEYLEPGSTWSAGEANVTFTNNAAGSSGAGGGDYSLTGGANAAYARVPAGRAVLKYDLVGVERRNDGTGAAGAYERTDL